MAGFLPGPSISSGSLPFSSFSPGPFGPFNPAFAQTQEQDSDDDGEEHSGFNNNSNNRSSNNNDGFNSNDSNHRDSSSSSSSRNRNTSNNNQSHSQNSNSNSSNHSNSQGNSTKSSSESTLSHSTLSSFSSLHSIPAAFTSTPLEIFTTQSITETVQMPNGAPVTLVSPSTTSRNTTTPTAPSSNISRSKSPNLPGIIIPVILAVVLFAGVVSFLFVRYRRKHKMTPSQIKPSPTIKSWNTVTWPGFEKLLSKTSLHKLSSGPTPRNTPMDLEAGPAPRDSPNSLAERSKLTNSTSMIWGSEKRIRSSQFSIVTLPPDS